MMTDVLRGMDSVKLQEYKEIGAAAWLTKHDPIGWEWIHRMLHDFDLPAFNDELASGGYRWVFIPEIDMYSKHYYGLADLSGKICGVVAKNVYGVWNFWIPPGGQFVEYRQFSYISKYYAMEACEDAMIAGGCEMFPPGRPH